MNAVVQAPYKRVKDELRDTVKYDRYPIERITLEGEECVRWIVEECKSPETITYYLTDAMNEWEGKKLAKSDALIAKLMSGTMTADELIEWRDILRAALIDYCSDWARKAIELQLDTE
jgi:hypothetical protein